MRSSLRSFLYTACGIGFLALTTGCEQCEVSTGDGEETKTKQGFCSVKKFTTDDRTDSQPYTSGTTVEVRSVNGRVRVIENNGSLRDLARRANDLMGVITPSWPYVPQVV